MLRALLHGKLSRQQENMEDLLTSMVFAHGPGADPATLQSARHGSTLYEVAMAKRTSSSVKRPHRTERAGRTLAVSEALDALRRLQRISVNRGLDALTDEEIEAEIRAVRAKRRRA